MKKISLIHPFTPQAAGVVEDSVPTYHSQPHLKAMEILSIRMKMNCKMEYFTPEREMYTVPFRNVEYVFYPVDFKWNNDHKKWKKQSSIKCLDVYKKDTPDVTIINMSAHSSRFSHDLAKVILEKNKQYIAMLGGQHYSDTTDNGIYYRNANHILVHTYTQKRDMENMDMFKNLDIRVFPLGVDSNVFKPLDYKSSSPQLLFIGRIVEWKRIHLAIETIKVLKDNGFPEAKLKIIGPVTSKEYLLKLKTLIINLELQNNVEILGHMEHHELPKYYQEANLFTLPSDKETFGMVMIEAMACGTPVAGINCPGGPADVITHLENGLLSTESQYSQMILEYFKNGNAVKEMSENARKKVLKEFDIEATYKILADSINSAL